jgi:MoaA/NifB/PqqE/SkfB family radical SAM enzyme
MCGLWKLEDQDSELPAARWLGLLDELRAWIGPFRLALNGGEIFLKPGVYDIIRRCVDLGVTLNPVSNGLVFQSERHFRLLLDSGLKAITFSLDGLDPQSHDRHRGSPGLHSAVASVIRRLKQERPRLSVSVICIIMRDTAPHLTEFVRWAGDLGVDNVLFQPIAEPAGRPEKDPAWSRTSELFVTDLAALDRSIAALLHLKTQSNLIELPSSALRGMQEYFTHPHDFQLKGRRCRLGQTDLRINPQGVVYLCDVRHTAIGHVDDGPLARLWRAGRARSARAAIRRCQRPCAALCHRSPGLLEKASTFWRYARAGRL